MSPRQRNQRFEFGVTFILVASILGLIAFAGQSHGASAELDALGLGFIANGFAVLGGLFSLLMLSAILVASQKALDSIKGHHIRHVRENDEARGNRLQDLYDRRQKLVSAHVFALQAVRIGMVLCSFLLAPRVSDWLGTSFVLSMVVIAIPVLVLSIVFELIPSSYAALYPHRVAAFLRPMILAVGAIFTIPANLVSGLANLVTRRFGGKAQYSIANQTEEEIKTLVESAEEMGEIESEERDLLHSVFEFGDTVAREVMTPRTELDAAPVNSDPHEVLKLIEESGHTRIPLFEGTDDQIVGVIHAKDLFLAILNQDQQPVSLRRLMRPPMFVTENRELHELLTEMRQSKTHLAVVQDEFGGTAGIVTIEDIIEELVGEIVDEYDDEAPAIVQENDGWLIDGKTNIDDVARMLGAEFESEEFDTLGGYVFGLFGRQPKLGESIEGEGFRFSVIETDGRRISRLKVERAVVPTSFDFVE